MSASLPTSVPDYFSSRKVSLGRTRPGPSPNSPHTPLLGRSISSIYNSPGGSFRNEEENNVVIDLGARFLRIGVAGEATPRCVLDFDPDEQRRVGDYRHYMPHDGKSRKRKRGDAWSQEWALYSNDVRGLDLGLVGDKLERACMKADGEILMLDERKKRLTVAISSLLPRPVLGAMLDTLFNVFQAPSITLLPTSIASLVGGGLRTGIVLDIGWSEAVATAIFEYREVLQRRSFRAGRLLCEATGSMLNGICKEQAPAAVPVTFEDAHEVLTRLTWCRASGKQESSADAVPPPALEAVLPSWPAASIAIPFDSLSEPSEALFASATDSTLRADSDDAPLPQLLFNALLALPTDVRKICMSRIIITGGSSRTPGLKRRLLQDFQALLGQRGWDPVRNYGKVQPKTRIHAVLPSRTRGADSNGGDDTPTPGTATPGSRASTPTPSGRTDPAADHDTAGGRGEPTARAAAAGRQGSISEPVPAHQRAQEADPILERVHAQQHRHGPAPQPPEGEVRFVETLGPWAGASLMASQRVKGAVEVEREAFARDGLWGAQGALVKEREGDEKERKREARKSLGAAKAVADKGFSLGTWA